MDDKGDILMKLFLCFPSTIGASEQTALLMTASYLETLQGFSTEILSQGCESFKRRATRFAPSVGEIYDRCAELQGKLAKENRLRLEANRNKSEFEHPENHRRIMQERWDELRASVGGNRLEPYAKGDKRNAMHEVRQAQKWIENYQAEIKNGQTGKIKISMGPELEAYFDRVFPVYSRDAS